MKAAVGNDANGTCAPFVWPVVLVIAPVAQGCNVGEESRETSWRPQVPLRAPSDANRVTYASADARPVIPSQSGARLFFRCCDCAAVVGLIADSSGVCGFDSHFSKSKIKQC